MTAIIALTGKHILRKSTIKSSSPYGIRLGRLVRISTSRSPGRPPYHTRPLSTFTTSSRPDTYSLFNYTSLRWLCNDDQRRKLRYVPFNVDALERIACRSVEAERCLSWKKIGEGSFNKVFLLHFDNDKVAAIRIPSPAAGNVQLATASEVATMTYISERWHYDERLVKPPKVLAWNGSYDNPAETPYIILDYADGVTLASRWAHIEGDAAYAAISLIRRMEISLLHNLPFSQSGSLYFAEDVSDELRQRPLYLSPPESTLHEKLAKKYRIGPTANREWWRGAYGAVEADRGPWPDIQSMIRSAAEFQLRAIDSGVIFRSPFTRSKESDLALLHRLLEMCIHIIPFVIPAYPALTAPVLKHPDMTLSNLIVPPEGLATITSVIDWQGATVSPFLLQCAMPVALDYSDGLIPVPKDGSMPPWPDNFDSMSEEEKVFVRAHHRYACRHRWFIDDVLTIDPLRTDAWKLPHTFTLINIVRNIPRLGADGPLVLQGLLLEMKEQWSEFTDDPCPIDFSEEEAAAHAAEERVDEEYTQNVRQLYAEIGCLEDTSIEPERFDAAKEEVEKRRAQWDEVAMKGPFPIYEGAHSWLLT